MWYDANGNLHETYLGELSGAGRNNRQPPPVQQSTQQGEQFPRRVFEIIFVDNRDQISQFKINSGCDQIFAAKDDSFFCIKSCIGNTYTEDFYPREGTQVPQEYLTRQEIPALIAAVMGEIKKEAEQDGAA